MSYDPLDPDSDIFKPPPIPVEVHCLHCNQEYDSYKIEWRVSTTPDGKAHGFWRCPTPGCDGAGFLFDIFPTDPDWRDEEGNKVWCSDDEEDDEDWEDDEIDEPKDSDDKPGELPS